MAKLNVAPTKSNLIAVKEQLAVAEEGYDLLEQKREILVMELMKRVEEVKLLEKEIGGRLSTAYPALTHMLLSIGRDKAGEIAEGVSYSFALDQRTVQVAGLGLPSLAVRLPERELQYSFMNSFADCDETMLEFFELLRLLTEMASIRTIVWRLAKEVKKTQRRVNALEKMVIPNTKETRAYIQSVLEEREREAFFIQKLLKNRPKGDTTEAI
jgi:V/A-type H+/Na+-transporting ATPase subunit D